MAGENYIPRTDTGNLIPPEYIDEIFKSTAEQSQVLAKARRLRDMDHAEMKMTVEDNLPVTYFVNGDTGFRQLTKSAWKGVSLYAEELASIVPIPRNVLDDANQPLWNEVKPQLAAALGAKIDAAMLIGTDKPKTWGPAIVAEAITRNHAVTIPATSPDLYDLIMGEDGLLAMVEKDGFLVSDHIAAIKMKSKLRSLRNEVGDPIFLSSMQGSISYMLDGASLVFPKNGALNDDPTVMDICGDFSQMVYSIRRDMTYEVFTEGVISDPATGKVLLNLMQQRTAAIMVTMRLGFALPNPVNMVNPDGTTRWPFAVLKTARSASA